MARHVLTLAEIADLCFLVGNFAVAPDLPPSTHPWLEVGQYGIVTHPWPSGKHTTTSVMR